MTVTIKDVAREANVSVATVSRALNGQHNVAEAVRRRIQDVAQRLSGEVTLACVPSAVGHFLPAAC